MACKSCGGGGRKQGECDVHVLVDNDHSTFWVEWCATCQAFICQECRYNLRKRAAAAIIRLRQRRNQ